MTLAQLEARIAALGERAKTEVVRELTETSVFALRAARANATTRLHRRTGRLAASITTRVDTTPAGAELHLLAGGGVVRYAHIQDQGGVIRPIRSKLLAIPIMAGLTGAGVARYASPRDIPGGFWLSRGGRPPLFVRPARGGKKGTGRERMDIFFVGVRSVRVPASHFATDAMKDAAAGLSGRIRNRFARVLQGIS